MHRLKLYVACQVSCQLRDHYGSLWSQENSWFGVEEEKYYHKPFWWRMKWIFCENHKKNIIKRYGECYSLKKRQKKEVVKK